jgi:hypothetical protein
MRENADSEIYWEMFCLTGEPLAYMLYRSAEGERPRRKPPGRGLPPHAGRREEPWRPRPTS